MGSPILPGFSNISKLWPKIAIVEKWGWKLDYLGGLHVGILILEPFSRFGSGGKLGYMGFMYKIGHFPFICLE